MFAVTPWYRVAILGLASLLGGACLSSPSGQGVDGGNSHRDGGGGGDGGSGSMDGGNPGAPDAGACRPLGDITDLWGDEGEWDVTGGCSLTSTQTEIAFTGAVAGQCTAIAKAYFDIDGADLIVKVAVTSADFLDWGMILPDGRLSQISFSAADHLVIETCTDATATGCTKAMDDPANLPDVEYWRMRHDGSSTFDWRFGADGMNWSAGTGAADLGSPPCLRPLIRAGGTGTVTLTLVSS
jgi:hypothetical protein